MACYLFVTMLTFSQLHFVASELKDPICHSNECQIGSFSSEPTICSFYFLDFDIVSLPAIYSADQNVTLTSADGGSTFTFSREVSEPLMEKKGKHGGTHIFQLIPIKNSFISRDYDLPWSYTLCRPQPIIHNFKPGYCPCRPLHVFPVSWTWCDKRS